MLFTKLSIKCTFRKAFEPNLSNCNWDGIFKDSYVFLGTDLRNTLIFSALVNFQMNRQCFLTYVKLLRRPDWPVRMLHPTDPLWEADSWPHLENILGCGARRPSVPQSASGLSNHRGAPPLCSAPPGHWEDDAAPLWNQTTTLKEHLESIYQNIRILEAFHSHSWCTSIVFCMFLTLHVHNQ